MPFVPVPLPHADLDLDASWLYVREASALRDALQRELPWSTHVVRLFGRDVASPRLSCWMGDPGALYRYSGVRQAPVAWHPAVAALRERLGDEHGLDFNSVLANLYRDGADGMGWHSDNERELGPMPIIASISLGGERRFVLKHRKDPNQRIALVLPSGSLLLMRGDTQRNYRHALPKTTRAVAARVNLTFRKINAKT